MKAYTDLEQSKKLAEILPIESADMHYLSGIARLGKSYSETQTPCWSLSALLKAIPNYKLSSEHNYHTCAAETSFGKEQVGWYDNPIDAVFEMILELKEKNLL